MLMCTWSRVITPDHFESTEQTNRLIQDFRDEWKLPNCSVHVINETTVNAGISFAAELAEADAIAMETHGPNRFIALLLW